MKSENKLEGKSKFICWPSFHPAVGERLSTPVQVVCSHMSDN